MANIVFLDDDFIISQDCKSLLENIGHSVFVADTATAALLEFQRRKIDLAIVDIVVQDSGILIRDGGIEFIIKQRAREKNNGDQSNPVPIIAISGSAGTALDPNSLLGRALAAGANCALAKPMNTDELVETVQTHLGQKPAMTAQPDA